MFSFPLGIAAGKLKNKMLLQVYIVLMIVVLANMILNGSVSIIFAGILEEVFTPTTAELGQIACDKALTGCCCCDDVTAEDMCPEWENYEIISLLVLDLKIAGITAFGCVLYIAGAIIIAVLVRTALVNYRVDYVGTGKVVEEVEDGEEDTSPAQEAHGLIGVGGLTKGSGSGSHYPPNGGIGGYNYPPGGSSEKLPQQLLKGRDSSKAAQQLASSFTPSTGSHYPPHGGTGGYNYPPGGGNGRSKTPDEDLVGAVELTAPAPAVADSNTSDDEEGDVYGEDETRGALDTIAALATQKQQQSKSESKSWVHLQQSGRRGGSFNLGQAGYHEQEEDEDDDDEEEEEED
jgi:hypothetical protein